MGILTICCCFHCQSSDTYFSLNIIQLFPVDLYSKQMDVLHSIGSHFKFCCVTPISISSPSFALVCPSVYVLVCVCVQRFVSEDLLPLDFQLQVLSGARLRHDLMVKLPMWPRTSGLITNNHGADVTGWNWNGLSSYIQQIVHGRRQTDLLSAL